MSRKCFALALLPGSLLATAAAASPPALTLPATVTGNTGAFVTVPATTTGKNVVWYALDEGLNLFPVQLLKDTRTAVVTSGKPGTYRLLAVTAAGDEVSVPVICTVTILAPPAKEPPAQTPQGGSVLLYDLGPQGCGPNGCPVVVPTTLFREFHR